jgi:hypothetical protein
MQTDHVPAYQLSNYFLYPRQIELFPLRSPPTLSALQPYAGGCFLLYGGQDALPSALLPSLDLAICSHDGCLYRVRSEP